MIRLITSLWLDGPRGWRFVDCYIYVTGGTCRLPHATCCKQASRQASEHNTLLTARSHLLQVKEKRWRWRWQRFTVLSLRRFYSSLAAGATAAAAITTTAIATTTATAATATGASAACNKSQFKWRPSMRGQNGARCLLLAACHMPPATCRMPLATGSPWHWLSFDAVVFVSNAHL